MKKNSVVLIALLMLLVVFAISCSCGDEETSDATATPSQSETIASEETGEGVLISSLPESEMPQMPEVETPENIDELDNEMDTEDTGSVPAILKFFKEVITVRRDGEWIETFSGMKIYPGDMIIIDEEANATVHSFDGSVSVLRGPCEIKFLISEKTIDGEEATSTVELELESGSVLTKVGDLFSSASSHKVRTANTVAGAWGTIYHVEITADRHTICRVPQGNIRVAYIARNLQGEPAIFTKVLKEKVSNFIDIPQADENLRIKLAQRLNLSGYDRRTILDHLENLLTAETGEESIASPVPTPDDKNSNQTPEPTRPSITATATPQPRSDDATPIPTPRSTIEPVTTTTPPDNSSSTTGFINMSQDDMFKQIMSAINRVETCKFDTVMEMDMGGGTSGMPYNIGMKMIQNGAIDYLSRKMQIDSMMTTLMDALDFSMDMEMYIIEDTMYTKIEGMFGLGEQWTKTEAPDIWTSNDMVAQMTTLLKASDVNISDGGYINGVDCYKVEMNPNLRQLYEAMSSQPGLNAGGNEGMVPEDFEMTGFADMVNEYSAIQWYAKSTLLPVQMDMDMAIVLDPDALEPMAVDETGEMRMNMHMTVSFSDYDQPVSIYLPPEAKTADSDLEMWQPSTDLIPDGSYFSSDLQNTTSAMPANDTTITDTGGISSFD